MLSETMLPSAKGIVRCVGVVGDIHCEDELLQTVLEHFISKCTDTILAVGDIVDGVGDADRVCDSLCKGKCSR
jgi:hypothetical protein